MKTKLRTLIFVLALCTGLFASCTKEFVEPQNNDKTKNLKEVKVQSGGQGTEDGF